MGYDIPKFYFHYLIFKDSDLNISDKKFAIIDGKQRLNAIFEFLDNQYPLDESVVFLENEDLDLKGLRYSMLTKNEKYRKVKNNIDNYVIDIIHVVTDEYERIEEMFLRLNEGVAVNNAEKRNSIGGYLISKINKFVKENSSFTVCVRFNNKRMQFQDLLTKLLLIESQNSIQSFTKKNLGSLVKKYKPRRNQRELNRSLKLEADNLILTVENNLNSLTRIFQSKDPLLRSKGIIPLYYWYFKQENVRVGDFRSFLEKFEASRIRNRKTANVRRANRTLLQFDRLNQQGAHLANSMVIRNRILDAFYLRFRSRRTIDLSLELNPLEIGLEVEEEEVF